MSLRVEYEYGPDGKESVHARNLSDLLCGLYRFKLALHLGLGEIAQRYRNTYLGPLWMTVSLSIFLGILGYVGGALFNIELAEYLPFLCLGVVLWTLISSVISESGQLFIMAPVSTVVYDVPMSTFVYSFIIRHLLLFAHNMLIYILIAFYFGINFIENLHLALLGIILLTIFCLGVSLILAIVCVKMRDVPQIVANLLQVSFFATPIMWKAELLVSRGRQVILDFNPFYYLIEIVRAPMLGQELAVEFYLVAALLAATSLFLGVATYAKYRHRVMFYL